MNVSLPSGLNRFQNLALGVGVTGVAMSAVGAIFDPRQFFISWLFAVLFWLGLSLGCFAVAMIHHLTGGRWGDATRRFLEAGYMTLPLMAVLFLPVCLGLHDLYSWARPAEVAASEILRHRAHYLNPSAFVLRAVFFFAIWIIMANRLRHWSREQDATTDLSATRRARALSGPGLVIYALTVTFAWVDWVMSLEPQWYSTMFPIIICGGQILAAFALSIIALARLREHPPLAGLIAPGHFNQLGNLLLTFVMFWTYVCFGQLLIIWAGNLPHEILWYRHRIAGGWKWIAGFLGVFNFFLPFFLLLFRASKRQPRALAVLAIIVFVSQVVNAYWLVEPSFFPDGIHVHWVDFTAPIGIGGLWLANGLAALKRAALLPRNDPRISFTFAHA